MLLFNNVSFNMSLFDGRAGLLITWDAINSANRKMIIEGRLFHSTIIFYMKPWLGTSAKKKKFMTLPHVIGKLFI